ncbi:phosphatase PAP2 family protein [Puia dinghuensis]|uniref:Aureobasidin A resistance protein n=1 Tax=Puia dinghuensis TaxID=1792502 RepID=A0A8J2UCL0_9BACT|nr:phosphatase PAP2 family protein [Puia dinghuensis]GGA96960.1 aureobasidin A resistance protein [Puia dinghuensis]
MDTTMDSPGPRPLTGTPLTLRTALTAVGISVLYLVLAASLLGFKTDQLILVGLFNILFFLSDPTRRFILGFTVFIIFWVLFDSMKLFPNYRYNTVHIEDLYHLEKSLFGIKGADGAIRTPNEFWYLHRQTFPDILAGCFYLCWIPLPLAFAGYLFYKNKEAFFQFALSFLIVNFVGFIVYYVCPAAPPWYVQQYGFAFNAHTPGNTAGLGRWDDYFHVHVFSGLYAKSSNVFAAMPSLHAAYPLTVLYYGIKYRLRWANALFAVIMTGIWFAAVYTSHHYVLDVLAGVTCGIIGIGLFQYMYRKIGWFTRMVKRWILAVTPRSAGTPEASASQSPRP